ncbi:peptidoglycan DD-metalloendopeptidase family protein [Terrimonas rubra]|uniref:Peptidoglycan DD-metalloendopeptidase family protein n=1 Tax=Terrimonas rubra TaxID=1035890 RepID=A0ABW6A2K6_9BACT
MRKTYFLLLALLFGTLTALQAQPLTDKSELEKERQALQKELKEIQNAYNTVKGQTTQNLKQLNLLQRKISLQEKYITSLSKELKTIDDDIYLSNLEIYRLQKQLDTLKDQYAKSVVYAYKNRSNYDYLNFIFSAENFNDAVKRITYLKSYKDYREKQASNILEHQALITKRQQQQISRKDQKKNVLETQNSERNVLADQKNEQNAVVQKLRGQENDLKKQIAAKQKRDKQLKSNIDAIVRREIEIARKKAADEIARQKAIEEDRRKALEAEKKLADAKAKENAPKTNPTTVTPTKPAETKTEQNVAVAKPKVEAEPKKVTNYLDFNAADVNLNKDINLNKGRLPWPVDNGVVTIEFGSYKIEGIAGGTVGDNPGITIAAPLGAPVKAVFEGEVAGMFTVDNSTTVILRHGKYFSTYSNLSGVTVGRGAKINRGQVLGRVAADDEGGGKLDFIFMIDNKNVNPRTWLSR